MEPAQRRRRCRLAVAPVAAVLAVVTAAHALVLTARAGRRCATALGAVSEDVATREENRLRRFDPVARQSRRQVVDYRVNAKKRPANIRKPHALLNSARMRIGSDTKPWRFVFSKWRQEFGKPDFALSHAAKAIARMPELTFKGMDEKNRWPVDELIERTVGFLKESNVTAREISGMLRACAELREDLPDLGEALLPCLLARWPEVIDDMWGEHLSNLILAERLEPDEDLRRALPDHLHILTHHVEHLKWREIPALLAAIRQLPEKDGKRAGALKALQASQLDQMKDLQLREIAMLFWGMGEDLEEDLYETLSQRVVFEAEFWSRKLVNPELWRIACSYALANRSDASLPMKAIARRALGEGLQTLHGWGVASLAWSFRRLETAKGDFKVFQRKLKTELYLRNIGEELVELSRLGPEGGGNKTLADLWSSMGPRDGMKKKPPLLAHVPGRRITKLLEITGGSRKKRELLSE